MDTKHLRQLAGFLRQNFDISNREDMPIIFDDYIQDYITEEVMKHIGDKEIIDNYYRQLKERSKNAKR